MQISLLARRVLILKRLVTEPPSVSQCGCRGAPGVQLLVSAEHFESEGAWLI